MTSLRAGAAALAGLFLATGGSGVPPDERERPPAFARDGRVRFVEDGDPVFPAALLSGREVVPLPDLPDGSLPDGNRLGALVVPDRILADLAHLTRVGADRLFRTSGTGGEREAFEWLAGRVGELEWLASIGATIERPRFRVPLASEVRRAEVALEVDRVEVPVTAHALQGHRDNLERALRFDSDGVPNDDAPDPVLVEGRVRVVRSPAEAGALPPGSLAGEVLVADYALVDRGVVTSAQASATATTLLLADPAALLLVTRFSNARGEAHGSFVGDVSAFASLLDVPAVPVLHVKLEDLGPAGIGSLGDLDRIARARLAWDSDVFVPGDSQLLLLRIPGADPSRAVVVGAHFDSPNSPGALDNGSGSTALLEAARVLDQAGVRPPVDTVLAWFGSHERGLYGSGVFTNANSELLRRAVAMVQLDCLTHPLDGMAGQWVSEGQSYRSFGDARVLLPAALAGLAGRAGVSVAAYETSGIISDNSSFDGFDVPSANTIWLSPQMTEVHVDGHLHDPYDDLPLAELHRRELAELARIALTAVVELPKGTAPLRTTPAKSHRAVFVASHTESPHMTLAHLAALGQALAWEGWSVDVVPFGTPVTAEALAGARLVVVLPVADHPDDRAGAAPYDEAFSAAEVSALTSWARSGGLLVLTTSAALLRYGTSQYAGNEDWSDANAVGAALGVTFAGSLLPGTSAQVVASHPLVAGLGSLRLVGGNGFTVQAASGTVLARAGSQAAVVLVPAGGRGEVLALGDAGILGGRDAAPNLAFFRNLARYARTRTSG